MLKVFSAFFIRFPGQVAGCMEDIRRISKTYHPTKGYPANHWKENTSGGHDLTGHSKKAANTKGPTSFSPITWSTICCCMRTACHLKTPLHQAHPNSICGNKKQDIQTTLQLKVDGYDHFHVETKTISFCSCEAAGVFTPLWVLKPFLAMCFSRYSAAISVLRTAIMVGGKNIGT